MNNKQPKPVSEQILFEITLLLNPLKRINQNVFGLFNDLGYKLPGSNVFQDGFPDLVSDIEGLISQVEIIEEAVDSENYLSLILELMYSTQSVVSLITKADGIISEIETELTDFPDFITNSGIVSPEFSRRLLDYLLFLYLQTRQPQIFSILHLIGIVEQEEFTAVGDWEPVPVGSTYSIRRVQWERFADLFTDPGGLIDTVYSWNSDFEGDKFLHRMEILLKAFLIPGGIYKQNKALRDYFGRDPGSEEIRFPLYQGGQWPGNYKEFDLNFFPIPAIDSQKAGLALYPYFIGNIEQKFDLSETWELIFKVELELEGGIGLQLRPPAKLVIDKNLFASPEKFSNTHIELGLVKKSPSDELILIFGSADGSYLGFREIGFNIIAAIRDGLEEIAIEMLINDLSLMIDMSKGDGFLQKILNGITIETVVDLGIGISNLDGFYFSGSGALEIAIPIHKTLGPITFHTVYTSLAIASDMELRFAVSMGFELGPISGSVEKIGIGFPFAFNGQNKGNFGPVDVKRPFFIPPIGAGLSLDAGGIVGGGYLEFDDVNKRYAGILALKFGEISLTAIGLITTKMPDGSKGFSLLANIGVTFNPAIQLSYGFTLNGVGGLIGINRTMEIDVLRVGIKTQTLDSILFPDPDTVIVNAQKIISDLRAVFPPAEGRFVVGPMIKLGWGTPTVITADIGIFIELPEPVRIVFMGQLEMVLPDKKAAIVTIHLDILGVLDIAKGELSFQATMYDSRLLTFSIYGDAAFLIAWKHDPRFALSMGGFHPKFLIPSPPTIFAEMQRLTICISAGSNLQLTCKAYQALTPNTLQFGARVDLYASASGAIIQGMLNFDTMIEFSPFSFEARMNAGVEISYKGKSLMSVDLTLLLTGPTPWVARGKAKIEVLFISVKVRFCITWGQEKKATLPAIDPWEKLQEVLELPESWGTVLPTGRTMVESLYIEENAENASIVVHSAGRLEVRQNVVPLDLTLDMAGNAPIKTHNRFTIDNLSINEEQLNSVSTTEFFARGQFEDVGSRKLSLPAFEKMNAGVTTAASDAVSMGGEPQATILNYESVLIKPDRTSKRPVDSDNKRVNGKIEWDDIGKLLGARAKRKNIERAGSDNRFSSPRKRAKVGIREESYCIVNANDLTPADIALESAQPNQNMTRTLADQILMVHSNQNPDSQGKYMVVPEYEVVV